MEKSEIRKNLRTLGIDSLDKLNRNPLNYWWKRKKIEIKLSSENQEKIKENLIKLNQAKEYLDTLDEEILKSSLCKNEDQINKNLNRKENNLMNINNLTESELSQIYKQRPDLKPKEIPSLKNVKLINPPTLDQIIVSFLGKYDIFIEPRNVGQWNGWDTFGTIMGIFSDRYSTSNLASSLFYMNRSNQINTAAQEWSTWKRWSLEQKDFNSFKEELLDQTEKYNNKLLEETRRAIQIAEEHNERVKKELNHPDIRKKLFPEL